MYDRKTVRRRRAVLLLLVACSLILVTASFGDGLRSVERGALDVFGPVQEGASRVLEPFRNAAGWVGDSLHAKGQVKDLRAQRDELRRELAAQQDAARENAQLRKMVGLDERLSLGQQGAVGARVFVKSPTVWYSTATINKGSKDGIHEGDPVIDGAGLVGRVRRVGSGNAQVLLLTDGEFAASARVSEADASGIVQTAIGDPNDLRLEPTGRNPRIRENETVVTAGTTSPTYPSRFPEGLPIGRVTTVDDDGTVHVRPFANLRELDDVQVLTAPQR